MTKLSIKAIHAYIRTHTKHTDATIGHACGSSKTYIRNIRKSLKLPTSDMERRRMLDCMIKELHNNGGLTTINTAAKKCGCSFRMAAKRCHALHLTPKKKPLYTSEQCRVSTLLNTSKQVAKRNGRKPITTPMDTIISVPDICAVTGITDREYRKKNKRHLAVDHCGVTGKVRGKLCGNINSAIGLLGDSPEIVIPMCERIIAYLQKPFPEDVVVQVVKSTTCQRETMTQHKGKNYVVSP